MKKLSLVIITLALSAGVSAQSLYIKNDNKKALGPKVPFSAVVQNYNSYTQTYFITLNGEKLDGSLTLKTKEKRIITINTQAKRDEEVIHRICLKAVPLVTQIMGMALCQNVRTF